MIQTKPRGVYGKYQIAHSDGSAVPPDAAYFVLRTDADRNARKALRTYAMSVRNEEKVAALCRNYQVRKTDGSAVSTEARYFVLRLDSDAHARRAVRAYARGIKEENPDLARQLAVWLWDFAPGPNCGCREAGCGHWGPEFGENARLMSDVGARL